MNLKIMKIKDSLELFIHHYMLLQWADWNLSEIHSEINRKFKSIHNGFGVGDPLVYCELMQGCNISVKFTKQSGPC